MNLLLDFSFFLMERRAPNLHGMFTHVMELENNLFCLGKSKAQANDHCMQGYDKKQWPNSAKREGHSQSLV
jgi:hypothetical protein